MRSKTKKYIAFIQTTKELPTDLLGVVFPDFPGCISGGNSFEEAFLNAHEAIALHVEELKNQGIKIPPPRTLEEIKSTWLDWKEWKGVSYTTTLISLYEMPIKKMYAIMLPTDLVTKIDQRTKNRSGFIAEAVRAYL